ncbi:Heavy metal transport/detoxification protein [Bosea sp. LC85]|uniref:heavy-metal-associated domain-containing protein n=1 Tax=Bosea sp. LC85 TaxID=1502851 RepID=UPI0004E2A4F6|nr:heavy-metal-associated domain-containing protein [Bosea sp. LC85]KFC75703.1 Heavy metal transport/detoxification protein [Bosea sp. LC85]
MCGCQSHSEKTTPQAEPQGAGTLSFRVEDMTCGHCAGTITKAIEASLPGTRVQADPASKLVSVQGSSDRAAIAAIVTAAGYTPQPVTA